MLKFLDRIDLTPAARIEQLLLHPCPHTLTSRVIMASSASTVHALNDSILTQYITVKPACVLLSTVRVVLSIIVDTISQKIYKPANIYYSTYSLR